MKRRTILLYGRTRSGKSTQIAALAEKIWSTLGLRTRVYTADKGGFGPLEPLVDLGIVEVIEQANTDPWVFLNAACRGKIRTSDGKWILDTTANANIGMFAFESMTAFADALMANLASRSAQGQSVGGQSNISFKVMGDGETVNIGGSNMAHYNVVQVRITEEVWMSQNLQAPYILWTASASKDDDLNASGKVIGPAVVGKALTAEVPRWFQYTFRIDAIPAQGGQKEKHILFLGNSVDPSAGNAVSLGNTRTPLDAPDLPSTIEPASLVKALELIESSTEKAKEVLKARLNMK